MIMEYFTDEMRATRVGYTDTEWASWFNNQRYIGYAHTYNGRFVLSKFSKQHTVALSATEAEFRALSDAS